MRVKAIAVICSLAFVLVLALSLSSQESKGSLVISGSSMVSCCIPDYAGEDVDQNIVLFRSYPARLELDSTGYLQAVVWDMWGDPKSDTWVAFLITAPNGDTSIPTRKSNELGMIELDFTPFEGVTGTYRIDANVDIGTGIRWGDDVEIEVYEPLPEQSIPPIVGIQVGVFLSAFISLALASSESAGYPIFNIIAFPMYSRLKREEVLDHFVRGQIYGYIVSNPGEHYNSIRESLQVTNGTLSYHLRTLEVQGFIKSRKEGMYRTFYPVEMKIPRDKGVKLSDLQMAILESAKNGNLPTQKEIAEELGISQQVASYNLRVLAMKGFVKFRKEGRKKRYYESEAQASGGL